MRISRYAKDRGRIYSGRTYPHICQVCGEHQATQIHHKFKRRTWAKRLYGDLIHHEKNRQYVCDACGSSHAGLGLIHWNEQEFCQALGIIAKSEVRALNRSNLHWLNEMQRLIPKDDQVNHAKIQRVMRGYPSNNY